MNNLFQEISFWLGLSTCPNKGCVHGVSPLQDIGDGYAVLLSSIITLFIAVIGGYITIRTNRVLSRVRMGYRYAIDNENEKNITLLKTVKAYINETDEKLKTNKKNIYISDIIKLLIHFENLSIGIRLGHISEKYIRLQQKTIIKQIFIGTKEILYEYRKTSKSIFINFEILFVRIYYREYLSIQGILEFAVGSPFFSLTKIKFLVYKFIYRFIYGDNRYYDNLNRLRNIKITLSIVSYFLILLILYIVL